MCNGNDFISKVMVIVMITFQKDFVSKKCVMVMVMKKLQCNGYVIHYIQK